MDRVWKASAVVAVGALAAGTWWDHRPMRAEAAAACPAWVLPVDDTVPLGCARVAGSQLGQLPLLVDVGGRTVRLEEWTATDEYQANWVGFAAELPPDVAYVVRAGDVFVGAEPRWLHPAGLVGPKVHGIEQVTFCRRPVGPAACRRAPVVVDAPTALATR